ncbi:hypothetical protein [Nostoc favosum]|uniref:Histidine kinase n=1 Tax=Nostoc favosum CHAB5714 TaxID=2780399 RepID=A0ABS8I4T1_9NOSO|nr:hypothetical protein [Nostoc favosum]MCC5599215.1 hypothetical protein [Nostoc favosum CHAB5714]
MGSGEWGVGKMREMREMRKQGRRTINYCPMPNAQCPMPHAQCPIPNDQ